MLQQQAEPVGKKTLIDIPKSVEQRKAIALETIIKKLDQIIGLLDDGSKNPTTQAQAGEAKAEKPKGKGSRPKKTGPSGEVVEE